ncbi:MULTISPECIES: hypothetical protein [unclassified Paenibacillus]|uniref:hypothetical protein n=1 Tax=unclassified Paenibacillus TaxID=185978 RepID=UPI001AE4B677|nr:MULTISPECIES: hypothetical protein [unclassified Paenibacillus]MBP1156035.1 hypothetical protein [Paenibacillus sp. PvP091]MBP1168579.1 hypothetical protein [Paenibacillus sp. PvR098]MBP2439607.1 hypothetical protein [Paenibacillus sp. PvP052]
MGRLVEVSPVNVWSGETEIFAAGIRVGPVVRARAASLTGTTVADVKLTNGSVTAEAL